MRGWCPPRSSKPLSRHSVSGGVFDSLPLRQHHIPPSAPTIANRKEMRRTAEYAEYAESPDSNLGCLCVYSVPSVVPSTPCYLGEESCSPARILLGLDLDPFVSRTKEENERQEQGVWVRLGRSVFSGVARFFVLRSPVCDNTHDS